MSVSPTPPVAGQDLSLALEALVTRFARMLRAVGARHGVGDDELEALVQDVRVRLWQAQTKGEEIQRLPTSYVYRTAMAAAVDMVRKRRRTLNREDSLDMATATATPERTDAAAMAAELGEAVTVALGTIPESRRIVVRLHLAGYEREEMAAMLKRSEGSIRNLLYRGIQELREQLVRAGYHWPEQS